MTLEDETERMPGRIQEDPKFFTGLKLGEAGPECQHLALSLIEVFDREVDVRLLRTIGTGPDRRLMIGRQLKRQGWPGFIS